MTTPRIRGDSILQAHPDLRLIGRDDGVQELALDGQAGILRADAATSAVLASFRSPHRVADLVDPTPAALGALRQWVAEGYLLVLADLTAARRPSARTDALMSLTKGAAIPSKKALARKVTREGKLSGLEFFVLDDVFAPREVRKIAKFFEPQAFELGVATDKKTGHIRHWGHRFPLDTPFVGAFAPLVAAFFPQARLDAYQALCHAYRYGDHATPHRDRPELSVTALYFVNERWDPSFMGEFVLYDRDGEAHSVIAPRPGRIVLFRGEIIHRAGIPSRLAFERRLSLAIQHRRLA
jgi:hypothetical protein